MTQSSAALAETADPTPFDSPLTAAITGRDSDIMAMVEDAIAQKNVMLAYQPVLSATGKNRPAFYEGLVRLLDPSGRTIPARDFISSVEDRETGRKIDCLALELGLRALADAPNLRLSINMSARSIGYQPWMDTLERGLAAGPTVGERLILEITESSAMVMPELVAAFMRDLQKHGIAFALDDFGAGYTSFRYLRDFYFDIIKIDGQFIRGISTNPDNQVLTGALVAIAKQFDMFTVAETVETEADALYLRSIGIDCLQGYYFAAPSIRPPWKLNRRAKRAKRQAG